ncbi:hypothetical protein AB0M47_08685 [Hamadaea sp. NPDC051192]|uniref:hypothetical protein n=1 Tax=Hamadaea sp. NPDC051192 TaxID=3154940 RepID=UPI00342A7B22
MEQHRSACARFLTSLDVYLMTTDELVWARKEALRTGRDANSATKDLRTTYASGRAELLAANAALQLAAEPTACARADDTVRHAQEMDRHVWNYVVHDGRQIPKDSQPTFDAVTQAREDFIAAARNLST